MPDLYAIEVEGELRPLTSEGLKAAEDCVRACFEDGDGIEFTIYRLTPVRRASNSKFLAWEDCEEAERKAGGE